MAAPAPSPSAGGRSTAVIEPAVAVQAVEVPPVPAALPVVPVLPVVVAVPPLAVGEKRHANHTRPFTTNHGEPVYQHACLRYVSNEPTNNSSIRERFGIADRNKAAA